MNSFGGGEDQQSSRWKTLTADFTSKKDCLGNLSSTTKPNFNVTHASLPDLSTCGVSCLADQVDSVVENVVPKIPSYGLREFQQRFEELRRENFSLKVSLSYAQLKLRELGVNDVFINGTAESLDDLSDVKKQLVEKEIAFAKARKEWDKEILIRDEKIMSLREKQRMAERVYQEAEILKIKCENLQEEKEEYDEMLKKLQLSYNILLEQYKAVNGSIIILDLKTRIAHLEAELDEKCNKLKQYANIDVEALENCIECKKVKGELELLEKKHNFEMEELEKQLRHAEKNAVMWKETLADLKLASDEKLPKLVTNLETNESHAVSSEEEIDRLKMEVEKERQKLVPNLGTAIGSRLATKLRQVYDRTKDLYSRLKSSAAALNAVRMKLANANGNELSTIAGLSTLNEDILENLNATAAFISLLEGNSFSHSLINGGDGGGGGTDNMFLHIVEAEDEIKQLRQHLDSRDKHIEELDGLLKSRQKMIDCLKLELDTFLSKKESSVDKAVETEVVIETSQDKAVLCKLSFDPISFDWPNLVTERYGWLPNFSCNFIQMLDLFAQITQKNDISDSKRDEYIGNLLTNMCETVLPLISQKNTIHSTNGVEQQDDDNEEENETWCRCRDYLLAEEFEEELRKMAIALKMCISATNAIFKIDNNTNNNADETVDSAKESLKSEPKKNCTTNGTTAVDGKGMLEVSADVGLKERNAKLEKYIKLVKGKFKQFEKYLLIGEEEVKLATTNNSSLTDLDRLDRVEMLLRSSDQREKQLSATIEQLERNNERLAEYKKYDLAKLKIEILQQAINNEKADKSIIPNNNNNNNGILEKENASNNNPSDNINIAPSSSNATMDKLNTTTTPTADKTMKIMDDLAELLTSSQKNISIAMNQFVKFLSESNKPKEQQMNLSKLIKDLKCSLENVRTCNVSIGACIRDTNGSLDDILIENKHLQQMVQELQQQLDDVRGELCSTVKDFDDYKSLVSDANRDIKEDLKKTGKVLQKFKKK
ncbi:Laminin subunit [Trichinella spiralis]|uniref:Laminin subunit n=1 Tax=Trichinella spiralis TaxID=6334 RepID=A0ABR3KJF6_TRISP